LADVFVSYSRREETALVDQLQAALADRGITCWVDRADIFPSSPWRSEIDQAILESHAFMFVLSPASVASPYCAAELSRAVSLAKRLVPVVAVETPPEAVPMALAELQFIEFTPSAAGDEAGFGRQLELLVTALSTDAESVHLHTRLLTQAERWAQKGNDRSFLLRGRELVEAERWLDEQTSAGRTVLPQQLRLVRDSRQSAIRRQQGSVTAAVTISAVMAVLAVLTALEWHVAVNQRQTAERERDVASSLYVAQESAGQLALDPQLALLLALRAYDFSPTQQAEEAVRTAVAQSSLAAALPDLGGESQWPFDASGRWVVGSQQSPATVSVWDIERRLGPGSPAQPFTARLANSALTRAQFGPGGVVLALAVRFPAQTDELYSWDWRAPGARPVARARVFADATLNRQGSQVASVTDDGDIVIQSAQSGRVLRTLLPSPGVGAVGTLVFSPDGRLIAGLGAHLTEVWRASGGPVATFDVAGSGAAAFSPDGSRLAIAMISPQVDVVSISSSHAPPVVHNLVLPSALGAHCCDVDEALALAWSPDGSTLAAATEDPVVWLWPGSATAPVYLPYGDEGRGQSVAFSPNGRYLVDGDLVFNWAATLVPSLNGGYERVAFNPRRDELAAASQNGGLLLWDYRTFTSRWLLAPPAHPPAAGALAGYWPLAFSPDGRYLAVGQPAAVSVWPVGGGRPVATVAVPHGADWGGPTAVEFAPDGHRLVIIAQAGIGTSDQDEVLDWRWASSRPPTQLVLPGALGYLAGFTAAGVRILSTPASGTGPSQLLLWGDKPEAAPRTTATIPARDDWDAAAVLADGRLLLSDQDGVAEYDPRARRFGPELDGYELSFTLSPSGRQAALTTASGQVEVWDVDGDSAPLLAFSGHGQPFVAWGPSGTALAVSDAVDGARVLPTVSFLPFAQLLPIARRLAVSSLSPAQERQFLP
jgi:WD40 repeat protein